MICCALQLPAQTLGGNSVFSFMKLPQSPVMTGLGGVNASYRGHEVSTTANNPSLLSKDLHGQLHASYNFFLEGIRALDVSGAYHHEKLGTSFGGNIFFIDYGNVAQTDAAGNINGSFRPVDFVVQVSASRPYLDKWTYGGTLKYIHSAYSIYRSSGIAVDAGILFEDTAKNFTASVLARNMGVQLKGYGEEKGDLPFDLQAGFTKKLTKAPLGFSVTAHHIHRFNLVYNDTTFNNENGFENKSDFFTKTMNHFVLATHIYLGPHLEASIGYNHLRRQELNIGSAGNGLNGFSAGLRAKFNKMEFQYGRAHYQRNIAYNHLGLTMNLPKLLSGL
jgi:hypothetical protein